MDSITEFERKRKKELAVLITTLILCVFAVVGCAYALIQNSQSDIDGDIDGCHYSIEYTDSNMVPISGTIDSEDDITITTHKVKDVSYTPIIQAGTFTKTFYITVLTDIANSQYTVGISADCSDLPFMSMRAFTPITVNGNTATQVTVTFDVTQTDMNTIGLTTVITDYDSLLDGIEELEDLHYTLSATATFIE